MALIHQLARQPGMPSGESVFKNYGLTDIPARAGVLFDGTNKGDAHNPPGIVIPTAAGGVAKTCGITLETIKAGSVGRVVTQGGAIAIANATLNPGDLVQLDDTALHMGEVKAAATTAEILGKCLSAAVAGDEVHIDVRPVAHN